ncbi:pyridoxamine 5'-phosphate oxidase family protein [Micromonospora sp. M12]
MLQKPNPAVMTTLRNGGQPVSAATWYLWEDGRILVNMDESRRRLEHVRNDPRCPSPCSTRPGGTPT